jgi:hypothetical protein
MNRKPRLAWELYLKMETSSESFMLLQLIANDCYKVRVCVCVCVCVCMRETHTHTRARSRECAFSQLLADGPVLLRGEGL